MEISRESAEEALGQIQVASAKARQGVILAGAAPILITWGLIWLVGYLGTYYFIIQQAYSKIGPMFWIISSIGGIISIFYGFKNPIRVQGSWRFGVLWLSTSVVGWFWLTLFYPWNGAQMNLFIASLVMFLWIMLGLIMNNPMWTISGTVFLLLIMGGALFITWRNPLLWTWLGVTCGGGMLGMGIVTAWMGRRHGRA